MIRAHLENITAIVQNFTKLKGILALKNLLSATAPKAHTATTTVNVFVGMVIN
jgi:hypothetical protein